jgi:hypothetical protein
MAIGDIRTSRRLSNLAIFAAATAAAVAFAALAARSDLDARSELDARSALDAGIALNVGPAGLVPTASHQHAGRKVTDQFATFYERWTNTATAAGAQ